mgnify:CR=1 FL=1
MSKSHRPYSDDFKKQAVDLALSNPEKSLKNPFKVF